MSFINHQSTTAGESIHDRPQHQHEGPRVQALQGGVFRATAGAPPVAAEDAPRGTQVAAYDITSRSSVAAPEHQQDNGLSARSATGRALGASEITETSIIRVQGQEMQVRTAERLGLIVRDANGYRSTTTRAAQSAPAVTAQGPQGTTSDAADGDVAHALPEAAAGLLGAYNAQVPGSALMHAAHEYLDAGEVSIGSIATLAGARGVEPAQVLADIENIREGFRTQAAAVIGSAEYLDAAEHFFPAEFGAAVRAQATRGDLSAFEGLARKVTDHVITTAASVESEDADIHVRTVHGKHLVSGPGIPGEIDVRQAVRLGMVSVRHG